MGHHADLLAIAAERVSEDPLGFETLGQLDCIQLWATDSGPVD
jgi:hypothetical protein